MPAQKAPAEHQGGWEGFLACGAHAVMAPHAGRPQCMFFLVLSSVNEVPTMTVSQRLR